MDDFLKVYRKATFVKHHNYNIDHVLKQRPDEGYFLVGTASHVTIADDDYEKSGIDSGHDFRVYILIKHEIETTG